MINEQENQHLQTCAVTQYVFTVRQDSPEVAKLADVLSQAVNCFHSYYPLDKDQIKSALDLALSSIEK